jgi:hypothetical protein
MNRSFWKLTLTVISLFAALTILLSGTFAPAAPQVGTTPANHVVWQHVGRIYVNPGTGAAIYYGYLVHINGITTPLFSGSPGEGTAYFTFRTKSERPPRLSSVDRTMEQFQAGTPQRRPLYQAGGPGGDGGAGREVGHTHLAPFVEAKVP